jgi:hypothetical protein
MDLRAEQIFLRACIVPINIGMIFSILFLAGPAAALSPSAASCLRAREGG